MEFLGCSDEYLHQTEIVVARLYKIVGSELYKSRSRLFYCSFLCSFGGQKNQKPRHTESAVGSFFVHKLPMGNIPQSNEPCHSSLSYVFRVLWNSFSYPRDACITSSQTIFAFGELWPHSLCNLQVNLRYARLHKLSHYFRKTYGLSLCT